jgi:hypothetical protein
MLAVRDRAIDGIGLSPTRFAALPAATKTFTSKLSIVLGTQPTGRANARPMTGSAKQSIGPQ